MTDLTCYIAIASAVGGMEIEEIAGKKPEEVIKFPINPQHGFRSFHARQIARKMRYTGSRIHRKGKVSKTHCCLHSGRSAPPRKKNGACWSSNHGQSKIEALRRAGVKVAEKPGDTAKLLAETLFRQRLLEKYICQRAIESN